MKAEIIMIHSQASNNPTIDMKQTFLLEELSSLGISVHLNLLLKEDLNDLTRRLELAQNRSNLVLLVGTVSNSDKRMHKTLAQHLSRPLQKVCEGALYNDEKATYILLPGAPADLETIFNQQTRTLIVDKLLIPYLTRHVKKLLKHQGKKITVAESLTGGAFLKAISDEAGASDIFEGGIVSYSNAVKHQVLGVRQLTIDRFGVVSAQCAIEMAEKSMIMFESDISISLTGVAGPDSLEGEQAGTVWIGLAQKGKEAFAKKFHFNSTREGNRNASVQSALTLVQLLLLEEAIENKVYFNEKEKID